MLTLMNVLMVVIIIGGLAQLVRDWRKGEWEHVDWTAADRKLVRTMRIVVLGSIVVAWISVLVAIVYRPDLIYPPKYNVIAGPLTITAFALVWNTSTLLESLRRTWGIRNLMIGATLASVLFLGASLAVLIIAWPPRLG